MVGSAIHWHELATGVHVSPRPELASHLLHHSIPLGCPSAPALSALVSCTKLGLVIYLTYGNIHVSTLFSQIIPPLPSPTESKRLFFTSVSLLLPRQGGKKFKLFLPFHISVVLFVGVVIIYPWSNTFRVAISDHTTELKKGSFASNHLSIWVSSEFLCATRFNDIIMT